MATIKARKILFFYWLLRCLIVYEVLSQSALSPHPLATKPNTRFTCERPSAKSGATASFSARGCLRAENALLHRAQRAGATTLERIPPDFPARPLRSGASRSLEVFIFILLSCISSIDKELITFHHQNESDDLENRLSTLLSPTLYPSQIFEMHLYSKML